MAPCGTASWPDGADQRAASGAVRFDCKNDFRCRGRRIVAQGHRDGAGVTGHASKHNPESRRTGDRGDDPDRQIMLQQHRALLDMNFDVAA